MSEASEGAAAESRDRPSHEYSAAGSGGVASDVGQLASGFRLLFESFGLLRRERGLWGLAMLPLVFSLLAATTALSLIYLNAGDIYGHVAAGLPVLEVEAWYQWIWLGPAKLILEVLAVAVFAIVTAVALVASILLASVAAAPFLDALSARVEVLVLGGPTDGPSEGAGGVGGLVGEVASSIGNELRRVAFFAGIWLALFVAGLLIPGAALVTGPLMVAVTILFLPLEYGGFSLDRRQVPFAARRRWVLANTPLMIGFGSAAFVSCFVPGVNLIMIPVLVVAGTLLVLRNPPSDASSG